MDYNFTLAPTMDVEQEQDNNSVVSLEYKGDVTVLAKSYMMYKIGDVLNQYYFPIIVPPGVVGNILSFLVMVQKHNRHMSFSLYISVLAVTDTIALLVGFSRYLNKMHEIDIPPSQFWYCTLSITIAWMSSLCSTSFILNMTFERFYSIIRPHKAASFNTVKRARKIIAVIIFVSILFNIPHLYITGINGRSCIPFGNAIDTLLGQFYHWFSLFINFAVPFVLLLIMNCFIIHTLRNRSKLTVIMAEGQGQSQGQSEGQTTKIKSSEMQIFVILLLVTFGFLILMTPSYVLFVYVMFVNYEKSPFDFAGFHLFYSVGQKTYYTNYAINFYLYVISGQKFRTDLMRLFGFENPLRNSASVSNFSNSSRSSSL